MVRLRLPWTSEKFSAQWSIGDPAFARWLRGREEADSEIVTPRTVLGLSAIIRAVSILSGTVADLPLWTYEKSDRVGGDRAKVDGAFDDPWPGVDGMTPFEWVETVMIHLVLWRNAYLWHENREPGQGFITAYRPIVPDYILKVERVGGKKRFTYRDADGQEQTVGSERITHIPGPSIDGLCGYPLLEPARAVFAAGISGDKAAETTLRRGIRLGGLVTPAENEDIPQKELDAILDLLREETVGREHSGDIAAINRRVELKQWVPNNIEAQWNETRQFWLGEAGRLTGVPGILLNDTEKQTSWGTGVAEQTLNFARFTLKHYTTRIEQALSRRDQAETGNKNRFVEFDYKGLLQGTPAEEIELLLKETDGGLLLKDEARKVMNLPPFTPAQKAEMALRAMPHIAPVPVTDPQPQETKA